MVELRWLQQPWPNPNELPPYTDPAYNKPTLSKAEAIATPPLFREALLNLARHSQELAECAA